MKGHAGRHGFASPRRDAPGLCRNRSPQETEGAGNAGCPMHPQPVCNGSKHTVVTTGSPVSAGIPCTMVLRLTPRSPRRRIRLVTVVCELTEYPRPVGPTLLRRLDTSNGCQDHTASPSATTSFVCAPPIAHGPKPALPPRFAHDAAASTASRPNVRDDGQRPSLGTGWRVSRTDLGQRRNRIFFGMGLDSRIKTIARRANHWSDYTLPCGPKLEGVERRASEIRDDLRTSSSGY
jgi:hypothetical protein